MSRGGVRRWVRAAMVGAVLAAGGCGSTKPAAAKAAAQPASTTTALTTPASISIDNDATQAQEVQTDFVAALQPIQQLSDHPTLAQIQAGVPSIESGLDHLVKMMQGEKWTSPQVGVDAELAYLGVQGTDLDFKQSELTAGLASTRKDLTAIEKLVAAANS